MSIEPVKIYDKFKHQIEISNIRHVFCWFCDITWLTLVVSRFAKLNGSPHAGWKITRDQGPNIGFVLLISFVSITILPELFQKLN